MSQDVKRLVIITAIPPDGTIAVTLQKLVPGLDVNFGTRKLYINTISHVGITTIVGIQVLKMVVYGVIQLILMLSGSIAMYQVCLFPYTAFLNLLMFSLRPRIQRSS